MNIDLGCGERRKEGFIRVDWNPLVEPDYCFDLGQGNWPLKSNTYNIIHCNHVFEHLTEIDMMLKEIIRIAKPGAFFYFSFPHYSVASIEPDHRGRWGIHCLALNPEFKLYEKDGVRVGWSPRRDKGWLYRFFNTVLSWFANLNPYLWERVFCYWFGGFSEVILQGRIEK